MTTTRSNISPSSPPAPVPTNANSGLPRESLGCALPDSSRTSSPWPWRHSNCSVLSPSRRSEEAVRARAPELAALFDAPRVPNGLVEAPGEGRHGDPRADVDEPLVKPAS